jgi:hypothetical protein
MEESATPVGLELGPVFKETTAHEALAAIKHAPILKLDAHLCARGIRLHLHGAAVLYIDLPEDEVVDRRCHLVPGYDLAIMELDLHVCATIFHTNKMAMLCMLKVTARKATPETS